MKRYFLLDRRQQSSNGKPDGAWLKVPPAPAKWVAHRESAQAFTAEEVDALQEAWPYLAGCSVVAVA